MNRKLYDSIVQDPVFVIGKDLIFVLHILSVIFLLPTDISNSTFSSKDRPNFDKYNKDTVSNFSV